MPNSRCSVARMYVAAQFVFSDTEKTCNYAGTMLTNKREDCWLTTIMGL